MDIEKLLKKRDFLNSKLDKIDKNLLENYKLDFIIGYTHNSTAIEGNTLSLIETKMLIEDKISVGGKSLREIYEVVNHEKAYRYVEECIAECKTLNEEIIKNIHQILNENIFIGGIYRNEVARITGASFTPPVGTDMFIQIKNFYADLTFKPELLNPIELAAWVHAEFVRVHPFPDGNGRTSRLIMNYILMENDFPPISVSVEERFNYYTALDKYGHYGDISEFEKLVANLVNKRLDEYISLIPEKELNLNEDKTKKTEIDL